MQRSPRASLLPVMASVCKADQWPIRWKLFTVYWDGCCHPGGPEKKSIQSLPGLVECATSSCHGLSQYLLFWLPWVPNTNGLRVFAPLLHRGSCSSSFQLGHSLCFPPTPTKGTMMAPPLTLLCFPQLPTMVLLCQNITVGNGPIFPVAPEGPEEVALHEM